MNSQLCLCFCSQNGFLPLKKYAMRRKRSCRSCLGGDTKAKLNSETSQYCSSVFETPHDCSFICSSSWTSKLLSRSTSLYVNVNSGWYDYPIVERNLFVLTIFFFAIFNLLPTKQKKIIVIFENDKVTQSQGSHLWSISTSKDQSFFHIH